MLQFFFYILFFLFILFSVGLVRRARIENQRADSFARLARKYHGKSSGGNWFGQPQAQLQVGGTPVTVELQSSGVGHHRFVLQFAIPWPKREMRCDIYPLRRRLRVRTAQGLPEIDLDVEPFNSRFVIETNDADTVRTLLNAGVQANIETLRSLAPRDDIFVSFQNGVLTIRKANARQNFATLDLFTSRCLEMYDEAIAALGQGIDYLERGDKAETEAPVCQVCGEEVVAEAVECLTCRTPHHQECWEYYGACSTFGCGQTRYTNR